MQITFWTSHKMFLCVEVEKFCNTVMFLLLFLLFVTFLKKLPPVFFFKKKKKKKKKVFASLYTHICFFGFAFEVKHAVPLLLYKLFVFERELVATCSFCFITEYELVSSRAEIWPNKKENEAKFQNMLLRVDRTLPWWKNQENVSCATRTSYRSRTFRSVGSREIQIPNLASRNVANSWVFVIYFSDNSRLHFQSLQLQWFHTDFIISVSLVYFFLEHKNFCFPPTASAKFHCTLNFFANRIHIYSCTERLQIFLVLSATDQVCQAWNKQPERGRKNNRTYM